MMILVLQSVSCRDYIIKTITSFKHFLDFNVICTESAVQFEVVSIIQERTSHREEQFLKTSRRYKQKPVYFIIIYQGDKENSYIFVQKP